ncbi:hypothetical protein GEMRC1_000892 [Eukaryota sp. GEM-RC1]
MNYDPGSFFLAVPSSEEEDDGDEPRAFIDLSEPIEDVPDVSFPMEIPELLNGVNDAEDYLDALKEKAFDQGFVIRLFRSKYTSSSSYIKLVCIHSTGSSEIGSTRVHSSFSNNCRFFLVLRRKRFPREWFVDREASCLEHNHQPSQDLSVYIQYRRFTFNPELRELAVYMIQSWIPADQIVDCLRLKDPSCCIIAQDIHNLKGAVSESLGLKPSVEELITKIHEQSFVVSLLWDADQHVTHFLFLHKKSLKYFEKFHTVIQVDCTYKTEANQLPLLAIVGTTPTLMTYHIGFCYMKSETNVDYSWVLSELRRICSVIPEVFVVDQDQALRNALSEVYSESKQVLCLWHICQNIQRHCQKKFRSVSEFSHFMHKFLKLVNVCDEEHFSQVNEEFQSEFAHFS